MVFIRMVSLGARIIDLRKLLIGIIPWRFFEITNTRQTNTRELAKCKKMKSQRKQNDLHDNFGNGFSFKMNKRKKQK